MKYMMKRIKSFIIRETLETKDATLLPRQFSSYRDEHDEDEVV